MPIQYAIIARKYRLYYQTYTTFIDANFNLDYVKISVLAMFLNGARPLSFQRLGTFKICSGLFFAVYSW